MTPDQSLSQLTANLLTKLEGHFKNSRPDLILAHGDTTTCFATAVSSFYHKIPFFHVEAGLRTRLIDSPFPEEFNRQVIAPIASHHFAPTSSEKANLIQDGISESAITVTGSTVHEALTTISNQASSTHDSCNFPLLGRRPLVVATLHRRESSETLEETLRGLKLAAIHRPDAVFVCPVHPNPNVQRAFRSHLSHIENIVLTEPLEYPRFISLLLRASLVVTDSGGVQEEAAFLGKRVLLARSETERTDGLRDGLVRLVSSRSSNILNSILSDLGHDPSHAPTQLCQVDSPLASQIIAEKVLRMVQ